jgi:hypothetical protein
MIDFILTGSMDLTGGRSKMAKDEDNCKEFKPRFYGFTDGIRKDESMADFCKRINKERVR